MKVLIVDDSAIMRKVITKALGELPSAIVEAEDGLQATSKSQSETFDVILMDWNMPNKSGIEALTEIRSRGDTTPVIMVTTESEKERVLEAIKSGASDYIIKPFKPEDIHQKIQRFKK